MVSPELYFFDCFGLYHKRGVFSKDQIDAANEAFESSSHKTNQGMKYYNVFDRNKIFIDMVNNPEIKQICNVCFDKEYRLDHAFIVQQKGFDQVGNGLHGKCFGKNMSHYYISSPQTHLETTCFTKTGQLSVGIVLKGQNYQTGGFCYIPGSHKTSYCVSGQNIHQVYLADNKLFRQRVTVPELEPGDLIAMPECLVHGQTFMGSGLRRIVYCMFFPLGNKFMDFSNEYRNIRSLESNPENLTIFRDTPENMLFSETSKRDISPYSIK